ncbi:hypothetical protein SDC9_174110 [bioreactor metagenome]|uniref:Uncharacterized protein n=1 Tax=bioreactor metagenome TaxID=1076179 RepID=A0A645GJ02_9ZZZZ
MARAAHGQHADDLPRCKRAKRFQLGDLRPILQKGEEGIDALVGIIRGLVLQKHALYER